MSHVRAQAVAEDFPTSFSMLKWPGAYTMSLDIITIRNEDSVPSVCFGLLKPAPCVLERTALSNGCWVAETLIALGGDTAEA